MLTSTWLRALLATNRQGMTQAQQRDGLRPQAEMGLRIYLIVGLQTKRAIPS